MEDPSPAPDVAAEFPITSLQQLVPEVIGLVDLVTFEVLLRVLRSAGTPEPALWAEAARLIIADEARTSPTWAEVDRICGRYHRHECAIERRLALASPTPYPMARAWLARHAGTVPPGHPGTPARAAP